MQLTKNISQLVRNLFAKKHAIRKQVEFEERKQFSDSVRKQFEELKEKGLSIPIFTL